MKHDMNKNVKIGLMLATLVAVAVLAAYWSTTYTPPPSPEEIRRRVPDIVRGDVEIFHTVKTVISSINVTLLIFLLIIYIDIYRKTKSEFTIGLIVFSMVLLLYALVSNPLLPWIFGFRAFGLGPFTMLPDLFTCIALAVLLYLTFRY